MVYDIGYSCYTTILFINGPSIWQWLLFFLFLFSINDTTTININYELGTMKKYFYHVMLFCWANFYCIMAWHVWVCGFSITFSSTLLCYYASDLFFSNSYLHHFSISNLPTIVEAWTDFKMINLLGIKGTFSCEICWEILALSFFCLDNLQLVFCNLIRSSKKTFNAVTLHY